MGISSDSLQLAAVEETTPGFIPQNPALDVLRITGEGLAYEVQTASSNELAGGGGGGVSDTYISGASVSGPINWELSYNTPWQYLLQGVLGEKWGNDPLAVGIGADEIYNGNQLLTYTLEKKWPDQATPGQALYQRFTGCSPASMSLSITPNTEISGNFQFSGNTLETDSAALPGATYVQPGTNPVMTAPYVTGITLYDSSGTRVFDVGTACFTDLTLNMNANTRAIPCIGTSGARETARGTLEITIDFSVYFTSNYLIDATLAELEFRLVVSMQDAAGGKYEFDFPRVKLVAQPPVAGGRDQDALITGQFTALRGTDGYSVKVTRVAAPPPGPLIVAATGAGPAATAIQIDLTAGPVTAAQSTLTVDLTADGGAAQPFALPLSTGQNTLAVAQKLARLINNDADFSAFQVGSAVQVSAAGTTTNITAATAAIT